MPTFRYRAYGMRGEFAQGTIEAASDRAAGDALWTQGLTAFQLDAAEGRAAKWWRRELFSTAGSARVDLASFTREFATLSAAEIPLDDALRILSEQATSTAMRALAANLLADVLNGATLSDAMQKRPEVFPADYLSVVRAGEVGGAVAEVLGELADLLDRRKEVRARIHSALIYPAILIALSLASLAIIAGALVPSIAPIFIGSGKPMPAAVSLILAVTSASPALLTGAMAAAAAVICALLFILRRPGARLAFDRCKLRLPLFGSFLLQRETARFARTLATLLKAGVPLLQASASARGVIANRHVAAGIDGAIAAVREGSALNRALRRETALPAIALRMISVGEEAGKLDRMLLRVAVLFEQQTQRSVDRFMTILTPLLTVTIAVLVGGLIMTIMDAVLSINDVVFR